MKYMMMMHAPRAGWKDAGIGTWPPEDIKAHIGFMMQFNKELKDAGELWTPRGWLCRNRPASSAPAKAARRRSPTARSRRPRSSWPATGSSTCETPGAGLRDRGARVGGARQRRRADEHANRGARGDVRRRPSDL